MVLDGRRSDTAGAVEAPPESPADRWQRCVERQPAGGALRRLLEEILTRLRDGGDAEELDRELDRRLPELVDAELLNAVREDAASKLAPFRARMSAERLETTLRRACADGLRRRLDLPRLASGVSGT